ncbi:MAG: NADH-quinone oxidoreductase subunit N [Chloroflexi bacterium]|nr:NADH-quinone oxidoreductase subunit N [Chloroflexota bacterium]
MTLHDVYLLAPELSLAALGALVVLLDLVLERKGILAAVSVVGLAVPLGFSLALWGAVSAEPSGQLTGIFGTLAVDKFALFFKFLFLACAALVIMASADYAAKFRHFQGEYYALILFSAVGMMLLAAATELISLYIALELTALPLAALAAFLRDSRSTEAGIKFLLLSALSSAVLLYGMALTFGFTGSTRLDQIGQVLASGGLDAGLPFGSYALLLGITMMVAGFGFKIASVPFQMWVPDVYEGAPTPITAYLSVASKAAGFAALLRVFYVALGSLDVDWGLLFAGLSVASMTVGNLVAIAQSNIKRMLAYSTIAHAGYMLVGLAAVASRAPGGETLGPGGLLFYLGAYTLTNLAAFFAVIAISNRIGSEAIDSFAGMGRRAPWVALALAFSMVSLIGVPPTAGFMAKLFIFSAAVNSNLAWLAIVGVINSVVSAYYYLRVIRVMYLAPAPSEEGVPTSGALRAALAITGAGVVFFGILPLPLLRLAQVAVRAILG